MSKVIDSIVVIRIALIGVANNLVGVNEMIGLLPKIGAGGGTSSKLLDLYLKRLSCRIYLYGRYRASVYGGRLDNS